MAIALAEEDLFSGYNPRPLKELVAAEERFAPKTRVHVTSEADVESDHVASVKADGGHSYKFTSPARRAVPDRLDLLPIPAEHRELVARYVRFTELKRPGKTATTAQEREHKALRDLGFFVQVIDQRKSK